jgi:hypothetical protein
LLDKLGSNFLSRRDCLVVFSLIAFSLGRCHWESTQNNIYKPVAEFIDPDLGDKVTDLRIRLQNKDIFTVSHNSETYILKIKRTIARSLYFFQKEYDSITLLYLCGFSKSVISPNEF